MADLELTLSWLSMSQCLERFMEAGFDSWETILEVTENDLEVFLGAYYLKYPTTADLTPDFECRFGFSQEAAEGDSQYQTARSRSCFPTAVVQILLPTTTTTTRTTTC